jgi:hypothetical protein
MTIQSIYTDFAGQIDATPRTVRIKCTDSLATITATNYLYNAELQGYTIKPSDIIEISYLNNAFGVFLPVFALSNGIQTITLTQAMQSVTTATGITAHAGGGQTNATPLTAKWNQVTTVANNGDSVLLPVSIPGTSILVSNNTAQSLDIYPLGTDIIDNFSAGAEISITAGQSAQLFCTSVGQWFAIRAN